MEDWVKAFITEKGGSIKADAAALLAHQIGPDLWAMANEADKLMFFADGHDITVEHVNKLVMLVSDANIFQVIDAIVEGRGSKAGLGLKTLIDDGASTSYILAMLTRQVRMVTLARDMMDRREKPQDIQSALGIKHDFVLRKTLEQAKRYQLPQLRVCYSKLLAADKAIKTSQMEPELVLTLLVEEMVRI